MTTQDIIKGLDLTSLPTVGAADINQAIDNAYMGGTRGLILESTDTALNVPEVPDASVTTKFKRCLWRRIPHSTAADKTPIYYYWDDADTSDATYKKWNSLLGLLDIDLEQLDASNLTSGVIPTARFGALSIPCTAIKYTSFIKSFLQQEQYANSGAIIANAFRSVDEPWINCKAFGELGDGVGTTVQQWITDGHYGDLNAIQDDYPWVKALTDTIDYVCIQDALNRAWDKMTDKYNSTTEETLDCAVPNVYLPEGVYKINRSLIIPPHCNFFGAGSGNTIIEYTKDINETLWSYMTKTSILPVAVLDGFYSALVIANGISYTRDYVTTGIDTKHNVAMEDATDVILAQDAKISNMRIRFGGNNTCGIYCPVARRYQFEDLYIQNITTSGRAGVYSYGFISSKLGGTTNTKAFVTALDIAGYLGLISDNIFANFNKAIELSGAGLVVSDNTFTAESTVNGGEPAIADGYCLKVLTEAAHARISGMEAAETVQYTNTINITGNSINATNATVANKPIYIGNTATSSINGYAENNGILGNAEVSETDIFNLVDNGLDTFKITDDALKTGTSMITKYTTYPGQLYNHAEYNGGNYYDFKTRDDLFVGEVGKVAIGTNQIQPGITYKVFSFSGTGSVSYNSGTYNSGDSFMGVSGFASFIPSGGAVVYKHPNNFWVPIRALRKTPLYDVGAIGTKTLSKDISLAVKELEGIVKVTFDTGDTHKTVYLP